MQKNKDIAILNNRLMAEKEKLNEEKEIYQDLKDRGLENEPHISDDELKSDNLTPADIKPSPQNPTKPQTKLPTASIKDKNEGKSYEETKTHEETTETTPDQVDNRIKLNGGNGHSEALDSMPDAPN